MYTKSYVYDVKLCCFFSLTVQLLRITGGAAVLKPNKLTIFQFSHNRRPSMDRQEIWNKDPDPYHYTKLGANMATWGL